MADAIYNGNRVIDMLLYAITSRVLLAESEAECAEKLVTLAGEWAASGVDFIQIRESDLPVADLTRLASKVVQAARASGNHTRVLINAGTETGLSIAVETGADGVHLPSGLNSKQLTAIVAKIHDSKIHNSWIRNPGQIRRNSVATPPISVSCHSIAEVQAARAAGATLALFAPVFEKVLPGTSALSGQGLEALAEACRAARKPAPEPPMPVLALGGVTLENVAQCVAAGAAGIAAIRLFLEWRKPGVAHVSPTPTGRSRQGRAERV